MGTVRLERRVTTTKGAQVSGNGDNIIIAAPTDGTCIVISAVTLQNESSTATTMQLTAGPSGTVIERVLAQNQGDGIARTYPIDARPRLPANTALVLNLSGANACGYTVQYYYAVP